MIRFGDEVCFPSYTEIWDRASSSVGLKVGVDKFVQYAKARRPVNPDKKIKEEKINILSARSCVTCRVRRTGCSLKFKTGCKSYKVSYVLKDQSRGKNDKLH